MQFVQLESAFLKIEEKFRRRRFVLFKIWRLSADSRSSSSSCLYTDPNNERKRRKEIMDKHRSPTYFISTDIKGPPYEGGNANETSAIASLLSRAGGVGESLIVEWNRHSIAFVPRLAKPVNLIEHPLSPSLIHFPPLSLLCSTQLPSIAIVTRNCSR